ncbi:MAG: YfhO family protein [Candidatus Andersenbacteria bacterium]|nr:YfhO family protein [Candidatus Andersenbacteria bacterium]
MKIEGKAIAGLIALCILAFYPLFEGKFYATGDMRDVTIPIESFFRQEQLSGRLPTWMPDAAFGFPIIAAAQIGFFYPPLLATRFLPLSVYLPLLVILHTIAAAIGTYLFARHLGQRQASAILAAVCVALAAFAWQHITHLNIYLALAWLPWQLLVVKKITQKPIVPPRGAAPRGALCTAKSDGVGLRSGVPWVGVMGLVLGMPFLIGQLQIPALMAGFSLLYYLILASEKRSLKGAIKQGILISLLAAAIASAQVLPTLELVKHSSRGTDGDFDIVTANQHSYPLYHVPTLVLPRFFGQDNTYWGKRLEIEYGFFIGTAPLILALGTLWQALKNKASSRDQLFFSFAAIISFLLALGSMSPFRLIGFEPSLWVFSAPARWLFISSFSLALLAGWGLDNLRPKTILKNKWLLVAGWAAAGVATYVLTQPQAVSWLLTSLQNIGNLHNPAQILKLSQLATYARHTSLSLYSPYTWLPLLALTAISLTPKHHLTKIILGVSIAELLIIASTTSPTIAWNQILTPPETVSTLPEPVRQGQARLFVVQPEGGDTGAWFTDPQSRADAPIRRQQKDLLVPLLSAQFHIAGIGWPASLDIQSIAKATSSLDTGDMKALADLNIGAITQVKEGVVVSATKHEPRISLSDTVTLVEKAIEYQPATPTYVTQNIEALHDSRLIIRDTWYPGWKAYLDHQPVQIQKTGPHNIFRAINIPSGQHLVEMKYEPAPLYFGLAISIFAILLSCALGGIGYKIRT